MKTATKKLVFEAFGEKPSLGHRDATKRLESCGMSVYAIERYKPTGIRKIWKAETDRGVRFVTSDGKRWAISREPPCSHAHPSEATESREILVKTTSSGQ